MSSALASEVILKALFEFPGVFVPGNDGIVEGNLALKGCRLSLIHLHVVDSFGEMNLFG